MNKFILSILALAALSTASFAEVGYGERLGACIDNEFTCVGKVADKFVGAFAGLVDTTLKPLKDAIDEENEANERRLKLQKLE